MGRSVKKPRLFQLMMAAECAHLIPPSVSPETHGREVVSWLIPDMVCMNVKGLRVVDGRVLDGTIRKGTSRPLIHAIAKEAGKRAAVDFARVRARGGRVFDAVRTDVYV